jgi:hypothetical protein
MPTTEHLAKMLEEAEALGLFKMPNTPCTIHFEVSKKTYQYVLRLSDNAGDEGSV